MMVKPLVVVLLLLGALVSETRAQGCDSVLKLFTNVCLDAVVGVDSTHSILASLSLPPTHTPIPHVPVRPPTPHAPTPPPSCTPAPAHPPSSPSPKAPPPSTPQPPTSPPSTPRPPAPSPPPSTPQAPPPQPSSICCQQVRNMAASSPTTTCRCLRGLISVDIVHKVLNSCGITLGVDLCVNL